MFRNKVLDPLLYDLLSRYKLLSATEEAGLCKRVEEDLKDHRARLAEWERKGQHGPKPVLDSANLHELVLCNLRLVFEFCAKRVGTSVDLDDLFQEAVLALMRTAEKFEPDRGFRFSTLAVHWIRHYLQRYIEVHGRTVRIPQQARTLRVKYRKLQQKYLADLGREPAQEEVLDQLGCSEGMLKIALTLEDVQILSIDASRDPENSKGYWREIDQHLTDWREEDPSFGACVTENREYLTSLFRYLPPRCQHLIELRYGLDAEGRERTLQEVSEILGLSRERVRQLENRSLRKLRRAALQTSRGLREANGTIERG